MEPQFDDMTVDDAQWREQQHHTDITIVKRKDRTLRACVRFFGSLAQEHGVRLSALVYHVVGWLRAKRQTDRSAYEYDPCEKFGLAIGCKAKQVYRLLKQAKAAGLLDYRKSLNQTHVWVTDDKLFTMPDEDKFYYDRDLAKKVGLNASILYVKIYHHTAHPEQDDVPGYRGGYMRFVKKFPWMTPASVKFDLQWLRAHRYIDWDKTGCYSGSFRYFVPKLLKAPQEESSTNTVRRLLGFKPDQAPLAPKALRGQPGRGHRTCSPQSHGASGKLHYNLDEE